MEDRASSGRVFHRRGRIWSDRHEIRTQRGSSSRLPEVQNERAISDAHVEKVENPKGSVVCLAEGGMKILLVTHPIFMNGPKSSHQYDFTIRKIMQSYHCHTKAVRPFNGFTEQFHAIFTLLVIH